MPDVRWGELMRGCLVMCFCSSSKPKPNDLFNCALRLFRQSRVRPHRSGPHGVGPPAQPACLNHRTVQPSQRHCDGGGFGQLFSVFRYIEQGWLYGCSTHTLPTNTSLASSQLPASPVLLFGSARPVRLPSSRHESAVSRTHANGSKL